MILSLGTFPTPVAAPFREMPRLVVKHDDLTGELYGGNKLRKLEHLVGAATQAGAKRLVTLGAVGSHHVLATTLYGRREGFEVDAVLVSQPASAHAEDNVRVSLALGLRAHAAPAWALAPPLVASLLGRDAFFVPLGGSSAAGSLGFVAAARELAAQVRAGELAEPDVIVVASGSGGTVAGLAVGLELEGLRTRVIGVAVSDPVIVLRLMALRLARATSRAAGLDRRAAARASARITIEGRYLGRGYGWPTEEGARATPLAAAGGVALDPTYTAKAFACAADLVRADPRRNVVYWHTLGAKGALPRIPQGDVPARIRRLLSPTG
ncbi:MAG: pyridoxal-phosphate dependent enzyme [Deltaproteobacteria bacterium]|nr:pyridoxal-phosphate dependent enzyme [Deltaproteobacteria bacterium]